MNGSLAAVSDRDRASVALVAEVAVLRELLGAAITSANHRLRVAMCVRSPDDAISALRVEQVDVVAVHASDAPAAIDSVGRLTRQVHVPVLVFGLRSLPQEVAAWERLGLAGCLTRDCSLEEMLTALALVARGSSIASVGECGCARRGLRSCGLFEAGSTLTQREAEVLAYVGDGLSNKEVASRLSISVSTVKNHLHSAYRKVGLHSRVEVLRRRDTFDYAPDSSDQSVSTPARVTLSSGMTLEEQTCGRSAVLLSSKA